MLGCFSRDEVQALLFIQDAKRFADILNVAAADMGQNVVDDEGHTAFSLRFANGLRIHCMSSNPDAQAANAATESSMNSRCTAIPANFTRSLTPVLFGVVVWKSFQTHRGSFNYFNELLREITERGNPKKFSLHRVTLEDALAEGFLYKLQQKLPAR